MYRSGNKFRTHFDESNGRQFARKRAPIELLDPPRPFARPFAPPFLRGPFQK